jgi:hypothetical protein
MRRRKQQLSNAEQGYRKSKIIIISVILVIAAANFLILISFNESKDNNNSEAIIKQKSPVVEQTKTDFAEDKTQIIETNKTDEILPDKADSKVEPVKTIQKETQATNSPKKETKSKRLRRAEKILTGF